ncbi:unnamed protein product [Owenia fusiformis]|uniref:Uncharacterized protein n=1 Tax=Owenia fusiformis TaxID=6347 RepID=A0A8J1XG03_OWEFU|nr:unnamed protein product [Owenia fusiformis]
MATRDDNSSVLDSASSSISYVYPPDIAYSHLIQENSQLKETNQDLRLKANALQEFANLYQTAQEELSSKDKLNTQLVKENEKLKEKLARKNDSAELSLIDDDIQNPVVLKDVRKENAELRQFVLEQGGNPFDTECYIQKIREQTRTIDRLEKTNRELKEEITSISSKITQPEDTIRLPQQSRQSQLQRKITELERRNAAKDTLCSSLTEETDRLKYQLKETSEKCETLIKKLDNKDSLQGLSGRRDYTAPPTKHQDIMAESNKLQKTRVEGKTETDDVTLLNAKIRDLEEDNRKMKEKLKEVVEMNTRWQHYNKQRDQFVTKLKDEKAILKSRIEEKEDPSRITWAEKEKMDMVLLESKKKIDDLEKELNKTQIDNFKLKESCFNQKSVIEALNERVNTLEEELEGKGLRGTNMQSIGKVEALEHQVELFRQDFESERRDRERAQATIETLREELAIANRLLADFQAGTMAQMNATRSVALRNLEDSYMDKQRGRQVQYALQEPSLLARGGQNMDYTRHADFTNEAPWMNNQAAYSPMNLQRNVTADRARNVTRGSNIKNEATDADDDEEGYDEVDSGVHDTHNGDFHLDSLPITGNDYIKSNNYTTKISQNNLNGYETKTRKSGNDYYSKDSIMDSDDMQCPKCHKSYRPHLAANLLKHIDLCCN